MREDVKSVCEAAKPGYICACVLPAVMLAVVMIQKTNMRLRTFAQLTIQSSSLSSRMKLGVGVTSTNF